MFYIKMEDNTNKLTRAFGYSRKSPDDKKNTDVSINNQNDIIIITCKDKGWTHDSTEEDRDISGGDRSRRGIKIQIEKAKQFKKQNPEINVYILVKDSKRFARDSTFFKETLIDLQSYDIKVFAIMKNDFLDPSNIGDRVMSVVDEQVIFDAKNYAKLSEKIKVSKSLPCVPASFGYKYDKDKNWVIKKSESKIIPDLLSDYVSGRDYKATMKDYKVTKGKYYRIIKNAKKGLFSGFVCYTKKYKDSDGNIIRTEEIKYKGSHEPIISEELFNKCNS